MGIETDRVKAEAGLAERMKASNTKQQTGNRATLTSEVLILPDGQVLAHNLTPTLATLLQELNPEDPQLTSRSQKSPQRQCVVGS
jgi:hypothetical protein